MDPMSDAETARNIDELQRLKDAAVSSGSYSEARALKLAIERLKVLGHNIYTTESARNAALEKEQYDLAKLLSDDVDMLHTARSRVMAGCTGQPPQEEELKPLEPKHLEVKTQLDAEPITQCHTDTNDSPPRRRGRLRKGMAPRRAELEGYVFTGVHRDNSAEPQDIMPELEPTAVQQGPIPPLPRKRGRPANPSTLAARMLKAAEAIELEDAFAGEEMQPRPAKRGRPPKKKRQRMMRLDTGLQGKPEPGGSPVEGSITSMEQDTQPTESRKSRNPFRIPHSHLELCPTDSQGIRWIGAILTSKPSSFVPQLQHFTPEQTHLIVAQAQRLYTDNPNHQWEYLKNPTNDYAVQQVLMPEVRAQNNFQPWKWPQMCMVGDAICFLPPTQRKRVNGTYIEHSMHDNYVLRFYLDMGGRRNAAQEQVFELYPPLELIEKNGGRDLRVKVWLPVVPDSLDPRVTRNFTYVTVTRKIHSRRTWEATFWAQSNLYIRKAVSQLYPHLEHLLEGPLEQHDVTSTMGDPDRLLLVLAGAVEEAEARAKAGNQDTAEAIDVDLTALASLHYASAYVQPDRPRPQPNMLHPTSHSLPYYPPVITTSASPPFTSPLTSPASGILYVAPADIHPKRNPAPRPPLAIPGTPAPFMIEAAANIVAPGTSAPEPSPEVSSLLPILTGVAAKPSVLPIHTMQQKPRPRPISVNAGKSMSAGLFPNKPTGSGPIAVRPSPVVLHARPRPAPLNAKLSPGPHLTSTGILAGTSPIPSSAGPFHATPVLASAMVGGFSAGSKEAGGEQSVRGQLRLYVGNSMRGGAGDSNSGKGGIDSSSRVAEIGNRLDDDRGINIGDRVVDVDSPWATNMNGGVATGRGADSAKGVDTSSREVYISIEGIVAGSNGVGISNAAIESGRLAGDGSIGTNSGSGHGLQALSQQEGDISMGGDDASDGEDDMSQGGDNMSDGAEDNIMSDGRDDMSEGGDDTSQDEVSRDGSHGGDFASLAASYAVSGGYGVDPASEQETGLVERKLAPVNLTVHKVEEENTGPMAIGSSPKPDPSPSHQLTSSPKASPPPSVTPTTSSPISNNDEIKHEVTEAKDPNGVSSPALGSSHSPISESLHEPAPHASGSPRNSVE